MIHLQYLLNSLPILLITLHDPQDTFQDTHQIVDELLEPIQQSQKKRTLDNTIVPDENRTHETNTDTHSFIVTTNSNILKLPTSQIQHNTNDIETTSLQNDSSIKIHKLLLPFNHKHFNNKFKFTFL